MATFKKNEQVTVFMGFTAQGIYQGKKAGKHLIYVDDPCCGAGVFGFALDSWNEAAQRFEV